ncbi:hypothetical protein Baya_9805 [Bagarius yarrelli]|uniref:Uncharacterized protein n=1 Tax=Bagarius yarrelli TaxID=175774 RepID=A0A556U8C7_BAGYA|nr:hypothetical protein Baya_9805 [Bagarius yarrelli]
MPVALRTRRWEDQLTPHSRKQYSYDDLDLVCFYANVGESHSPTGHRRHGRCASMPECCPHKSCPGEKRNRRRKTLSGTFKSIAFSYGCDSQTGTKCHTLATVRQAMADDHTIQSKDCLSSPYHSACILKHSLDVSLNGMHTQNEETFRKSMATPSGSSSTNTEEEQNKKFNFSTTESETNDALKDNAKLNITMAVKSREKLETGAELITEGNTGEPVKKASSLHPQHEIRVGLEATDIVSDKNITEVSPLPPTHSNAITSTDLASNIKQSEKSQVPQNNVVVFHSSNPNSNNYQIVTIEEILLAHNPQASTEPEVFLCISRSTSNPNTSRDYYAKLHPIPEVFFTESGVEEGMLKLIKENTSEPHISTTSGDLECAGNVKNISVPLEMQQDTPVAGLLGNFQKDISEDLPGCESKSESKMETLDCVMIPQTSPSIHEEERDNKPQEAPVRLRSKKPADWVYCINGLGDEEKFQPLKKQMHWRALDGAKDVYRLFKSSRAAIHNVSVSWSAYLDIYLPLWGPIRKHCYYLERKACFINNRL